MTNQQTFGRRGAVRLKTPSTRLKETAQPIEAVTRRHGWGWGGTALVVVVGIIGLAVVGNLIDPAAVGGTAPGPVSKVASSKPAVPVKCEASLAKYGALQTGSTIEQSARTIGCRGTEMSRMAIGGQESVTISWDGNAFISSMTATFSNDRLVAKSQLGLE